MHYIISANLDSMVDTTLRQSLKPELERLGHIVSEHKAPGDSDLMQANVLISRKISVGELLRIKRRHPALIVVIADPKVLTRNEVKGAILADLCLVGSREHQAQIAKLGGRSVRFTWRPQLEGYPISADAGRNEGKKFRLFYHGNRAHLESLTRTALREIDSLAKNYPLVLEAHYSMSHTGKWRVPPWVRNLEIEHCDWREPHVWQRLKLSDIGIVPNALPARTFSPLIQRRTRLNSWMNSMILRRDDYLLRFKATSNPGRILPFAHFGKPIVSDFFPSSAEIVRDGLDGFLPLNSTQWHTSLDILINDGNLRQRMGMSLKSRCEEFFSVEEETARFVKEIGRLSDRFLA